MFFVSFDVKIYFMAVACKRRHLPAHSDAELGDARDGLVRHEVTDAHGAALSLAEEEGNVRCLVLDGVDALPQGIAFGVGQGAADGVAPVGGWCFEALLYGEHDVLHADGGCHAKSYGEHPADVLLCLRQGEAYGVAPLPAFLGQRLVAVQPCATRTGSTQQTNQRNEKCSIHNIHYNGFDGLDLLYFTTD